MITTIIFYLFGAGLFAFILLGVGAAGTQRKVKQFRRGEKK